MADDHASSVNFVRSFGDSSQSAINVTATLTLQNGVKQEFCERVSQGGAVPKLKNVREALKAVRTASQDAVNQMVEEERRQPSTQQQITKDGEESDYDEDDDDENSEEKALSGTGKNVANDTHELQLNLSTQPPEKRLKKSDNSSENKGVL